MKLFLYTLSLCYITILISCDKVNDPFSHKDNDISNFGNPAFNDTSIKISDKNRIIVLEDYTGHKCANCPLATTIGKSIEKNNPEQVILIGIHNSLSFSKPDPPKYPANFETVTGENLRAKININGFPNGTINRKSFRGKTVIPPNLWEANVNELLDDNDYITSPINITSTIIYNTDKKTVRVYPKIEVLNNIVGNLYFSSFLIEKGIVSPQLNSRANPSYIPNYLHHNVLRKGFEQNNIGSFLFSNPTKGSIYNSDSIHTAATVLDKNWNVDSMYILSFVYDNTNNEIIQGTFSKLKK